MAEPVLARLLDATLPYVCGRRLVAHGLDDADLAVMSTWSDAASSQTVTVSVGVAQKAKLLLLLLPGVSEPPALAGMEVIETRYAFTVPGGLADDTAAPTLNPDPNWPYSRQAAGIWLDAVKPKQTLGCLLIARSQE